MIKTVNYHIDKYEIYLSKKDLFEKFFTDFYNFILSHDGKSDLLNKNIHSKEDFLAFADYYADGLENCYGMGFAFNKYFLNPMEEAGLDSQNDDTFIGYCVKNNKYINFINFLITFFAWWRNDEGCTTFDPYNHADEFFNSSWAALVDTCKLFYYSAETVYHWQSFRVKYALDNILGTLKTEYLPSETFTDKIKLRDIKVSGYEFKGWTDKDGNIVKEVSESMDVYLLLIQKDFYDYWGKEEKKIKKVKIKDYKKADPI